MIESARLARSPRVLAVAGLFASTLSAIAMVALPARAADWPQANSDVPGDPAVLFGKLPNGLRYAIMHNATPKGAVAMRLAIDGGSIDESDAQQGLAHFTEHMAFRGSKHVPEAEVWSGLQRLGMGIGADANAETAWTMTKYQWNLPRNDDKTVDAGLMRLREIASELTLDQRAMDDERGPILSEERLRDTPEFRSTKAFLNLVAPNSLATRRFPIGLTDVIKHAPVSLIRDFYQHYYRPDRAAVIVIGDIDPKAMEAKIAAHFGDWKPVGPAGTDPVIAPPGARAPQADLFVDAGAPSMLILAWTGRLEPDTKARETRELTALIGFQILGYRLQDLAAGPQHPFGEPQIGQDRLFHTALLQSVALVIRPQDWRLALDAAVTALRRIDQYGVSEDEVKRAEEELGARLQTDAAQANTRNSPEVADELAKSFDENEVFESPAYSLAMANEIFKTLTPDKVSAGLREIMRGHGPLVLVDSPIPVPGGKQAVAAALDAAQKAPLTAATAQAAVVWPYLSFGTPGEVVEHKNIADLSLDFFRFANGVRLTVKPTKFTAGQVAVEVRIGSGRLGLSPRQYTPRWAVYSGFFAGGTKRISQDEMRRVLAGKVYQTHAILGDDGLKLWGQTRPADLATQMQVFAAYVSAPGWRPSGIDAARTATADELGKAGGSPGGVLGLHISALLHSGDQRWVTPTLAQVAALKPQDLENLLAPDLAAGPIEITVVGDIPVDAAVRAIATNFGALPRRAEPTAPSSEALAVHFPAATTTPVILHHGGRADQGIALAAWPTTDTFAGQTLADLRILRSVLETRILDQLRIREGATYSPEVSLSASRIFPHYGYMLAATELPLAKMPLFFSAVASIVADLKAHPISADELERARKPTLEQIVTERQSNDYWSDVLLEAQSDPRILPAIRATLPNLGRIDAAAIQHAAQTYLSDKTRWTLEITPQPATAADH